MGNAGVSIEVFADFDTTAEDMLAQGREMFSWIPNAYTKNPCTKEGLRAAQASVHQDIRVNHDAVLFARAGRCRLRRDEGLKTASLRFSFLGRLDDRGQNGVDLVRNIKKMYELGDAHVLVLAASIRSLNHLLGAFALQSDLATAPAKVWEEWASKSFPLPGQDFVYEGLDKNGARLQNIPYKPIDLNRDWESFDIHHDLTDKGIRQFVADYENTLKKSA